MAKIALLVGVSEYSTELTPLPSALKDIAAMKQTLENPKISGFDQVQVLENPNPMEMQEAIETLFSQRQKEDLALLFFSGHGIKDDSGRLYFATPSTRKTERGDLVRATAVPATFVQDVMGNSRCKRQLVFLDCCFSGAFAHGMTAKSDRAVDIEAQLGGEGRAVLTSSTATQYSFESEEQELSVYTHYLIEGLQTGAADTDGDGHISVDELHEYASHKVRETSPAMKPKIFAVEEGFKIQVAKAAIADPAVRYRKVVEKVASKGKISDIGRHTLNALRDSLRSPQFTDQQANAIEEEVLKPYRDYERKCQRYEQVYADALQRESPLSPHTRDELAHFQQVLQLPASDIDAIETRVAQRLATVSTSPPTASSGSTPSPSPPQSPETPAALSASPAPPLSQSLSAPPAPPKTPSAPAANTARPQASSAPSSASTPTPSVPKQWLIGGGIAAAVAVGAIALTVGGGPNTDVDDPSVVSERAAEDYDNPASDPDARDNGRAERPEAEPPGTTPTPALITHSSEACNASFLHFSLPVSYSCQSLGANAIAFRAPGVSLQGSISQKTLEQPLPSQTDQLHDRLEDELEDYFASGRFGDKHPSLSLSTEYPPRLLQDPANEMEEQIEWLADDPQGREIEGNTWVTDPSETTISVLTLYHAPLRTDVARNAVDQQIDELLDRFYEEP